MNVLELAIAHGLAPKKVSGTHGGEYAGACPFCGGNDRFRIWEDQNEGRGSYWCRGCHKHGDNIQFVMDTQGVGFREAANKTGDTDKLKPLGDRPSGCMTNWMHGGSAKKSVFDPRVPGKVSDLWAEKAGKLVEWAKERLAGSDGEKILRNKGLSAETCDRMNLGWIPEDCYRPRESWGLPTEMKDDGKPKRLWISAGIVIPMYDSDGRVVRIRIRRRSEDEPRYPMVKGSSVRQMLLGNPDRCIVVVESELDAILIDQLAGDITGVLSLGNAQSKPDEPAFSALNKALRILVALDFDIAGKSAFGWWHREFVRAIRWPVPNGKDPSDAHSEGSDIRSWVIAGWPAGWRINHGAKPRDKRVPSEDIPMPGSGFQPGACKNPYINPSDQDDNFEKMDGIDQLYALLKKNTGIRIHMQENRMVLDVPKEWRSRHSSYYSRISNLVYFDPMVFEYLHLHGGPVVTADNFLREL